MATLSELKSLALHAAKRTAPENFSSENVDEALRGELNKLGGSINQFMKNRYDIYEIIITPVDEIVPKQVMDALKPVAEIKMVPQGQTARFRRKLGRQRAKQFITQVGLSGVYETFRLDHEDYEVAVKSIGAAATVDFERLLDGAENMAELMDIVAEGQVNAIYQEVQKVLKASLNNSGRPAANKVVFSGFNGEEMAKLINVVKAYGTSAVIMAPPEFIAAMGPDAIVPGGASFQGVYHQQDIDAIHNLGHITIFRGTPIVQIPQSFIDENNNKTWIDPQMAYVLPVGSEKVVKIVMEGDSQIYDNKNRDQSLEIDVYRKVGVAIATHHNWGIYQNTKITQTYEDQYDI